jgi:hypothetical protein
MLLAQQLATAYADGDWETARRISPVPAWDDETYEEGFAGLEASTMFLGGTDTATAGRLGMYLMQVAHETRQEGPQTSIYCVRWDLVIESSTIDRIAGKLLLREPGFTPPTDAERGVGSCDRFDQQPADTPAPPVPPVPPPAAPPVNPAPIFGFDPGTCTFNGIPLYGKVKVVTLLADIKIQESFSPDLRIQEVNFGADSCGEWQFVEFGPADFTVQFVRVLPDITVSFTSRSPGTG